MEKTVWTVVAVALVVCMSADRSAADEAGKVRARGEYMIKVMDCGACHTPWKLGSKGPEPDAAKFLSGHPRDAGLPPPPVLSPGPWNTVTGGNTAWSGPWGISYSSNLTPDAETGLGSWTEKAFADSMRTGRHLGTGRELLPPMPRYPDLTDEDLHAMFVYLASIPPISNRVPDPETPRKTP